MLVNTSFNVRGEPIVCTPEDAFRCFMATDLDVLAIENFVLYKTEQTANEQRGYIDGFELD
jgi:carbamoyltransferase